MDNGTWNYRRYLEGNDEGISEIIIEYRDGLIFYINSFVNDLEAAENLAEDTFVYLAFKKPRFREKSTFKTWLYAIGRNTALKKLKKKNKEPRNFENMDYSDIQSVSPELEYFKKESNVRLHRCISTLKEEYRQVLWLYYFDGFTVSEISEIMKKSESNINTLLHRARSAVKEKLEKEGYEYENL